MRFDYSIVEVAVALTSGATLMLRQNYSDLKNITATILFATANNISQLGQDVPSSVRHIVSYSNIQCGTSHVIATQPVLHLYGTPETAAFSLVSEREFIDRPLH